MTLSGWVSSHRPCWSRPNAWSGWGWGPVAFKGLGGCTLLWRAGVLCVQKCARRTPWTYTHTHTHVERYVYISIYIYICVCVFIYRFIFPIPYVFIYEFPFVFLICIYTISTSIHPSIRPSVHPSIRSSVHPSIHTYIHTSIHPCIHAYIVLASKNRARNCVHFVKVVWAAVGWGGVGPKPFNWAYTILHIYLMLR